MADFRRFLPWATLAALLGLTFWIRCWNSGQVFVNHQIYFVDADCYSRMTRVQQVVTRPFASIRMHDFENAPAGTLPHTTAPMDLAIAKLTWILTPFSDRALDLAGAYISPLLGVLLAAFLWWWGRKLDLSYRYATLLLVTISPILVHGFLLGRPDHQSLILFLVGAALGAELALWTRAKSRAWSFVSAVCWALALWTSLFEPFILLLAVLLCRVLVLGLKAGKIREPGALAAFFAILGLALLFDGWHPPPTDPIIREFFPRWSRTIGELNHLNFTQLFPWTGWLLPIVPLLLFFRFGREKDRVCLALGLLVVLAIGLSLWYARWGYFLALVFALSLPWALAKVPNRPLVWLIFLASLWPAAAEWQKQLFPSPARKAALAEARQDNILLRETARALISPERYIILAPWWLSPALAYWSGQRCVAGSSHQSLPGTVDSARFYLATDPAAAREILQRRKVAYVVVYEPSRVLGNSAQILEATPRQGSMGKALYDQPFAAPPWLRLAYRNPYFKVYEFVTGP